MKNILFKPFPTTIGRIARIIALAVYTAAGSYIIFGLIVYVLISDTLPLARLVIISSIRD